MVGGGGAGSEGLAQRRLGEGDEGRAEVDLEEGAGLLEGGLVVVGDVDPLCCLHEGHLLHLDYLRDGRDCEGGGVDPQDAAAGDLLGNVGGHVAGVEIDLQEEGGAPREEAALGPDHEAVEGDLPLPEKLVPPQDPLRQGLPSLAEHHHRVIPEPLREQQGSGRPLGAVGLNRSINLPLQPLQRHGPIPVHDYQSLLLKQDRLKQGGLPIGRS